MTARPPQIVAFGGGGFSMEKGNRLLDDYVLEQTHVPRPRVCFMPSASGDADHYIVRFYRTFDAGRCEPTHVSLFRRDDGASGDLRSHLLSQDLIYVGGGNVISLLGVWRAHGLDEILRECWQAGVVMCGLSAGSLCWFAQGVTAFVGEPRVIDGLGFLPWSNAVHYDGERGRREQYHGFLREGGLQPGYACDDGAALHFVGHDLERAISSRRGARAYRVELSGDDVTETPLRTRHLARIAVVAA
jgi:dipeptidase E